MIKSYTPFFGEHYVLRIGDKLEVFTLSFNEKHTMLLIYDDIIGQLSLELIHKENMYCGATVLLANVRQC